MKIFVLTDDANGTIVAGESKRACIEYLVEYHYLTFYDEIWSDEEEAWTSIHKIMHKEPEDITFDELVDWVLTNWDRFYEYLFFEQIEFRKEYK